MENNKPKPTVVVSKCLGFDSCRYDGQKLFDTFIEKLKPFVHYISVCPEVEMGLGTPREPIRLVSTQNNIELFQPATGLDFTEKMNEFSYRFLSSLDDVDGFILKGRSPSCGIKDVKVYLGKEKTTGSIKGTGIFTQAVLNTYPLCSIEEEGRLTNFILREHFLTKLFTVFSFRKVKESQSIGELVKFQSNNKYLLMAYSQKEQKKLGNITANHDNKDFNIVIEEYASHLSTALSHPPRPGVMVNVLMHIMGYFSNQLSYKEKEYLLNTFEKYRQDQVPLSVPVHLLKSYVIKYEQKYLLDQSIWQPYPEALIDIHDSGKGHSR